MNTLLQFFVVLRVLRKPPPPIDADVPGNKRLKNATEATALRRKAKQKSKKLTKNEIMESKVAPGARLALATEGQCKTKRNLEKPTLAASLITIVHTPAPPRTLQISSYLCRCATSGPTRSSSASPTHPKRKSRRSSIHRRSVRRRGNPSSGVRRRRMGALLEAVALAGRAPWGV